jgi:murein DD-endopeptidase MepM/ murein hydrolase activator NlpD
MPVNGDVLVPFSDSANVFFEALREWRFHPGIDIETSIGALVKAAADGVVTEVLENAPRNMGVSVIIEHSGGYKTAYSNLSPTVIAAVGDTVTAGDTIGSVGSTSMAEAALPPHLHFEIIKDGEHVDPLDYLP